MKNLMAGDDAIDFNFKDYLGNRIHLNNYKGRKVLLSFFRGASCPFCNLRINQLINRFDKFREKQIEIIALFGSSKNEIAQYAGKQKAPFPIIPDPKLYVYKKYGIEESHAGMIKAMLKPLEMFQVMTSGFFNLKAVMDKALIPADFLIDENLNIWRVFYGKDFGDHLPIDEILKWQK